MPAASARNLMVGTGTVSTTSGSKVLTFSANQTFKEGATVVADYAGTPQYFTMDTGAGTTWHAMQDATATASGVAYKASNTGTVRTRGTDGVIVPNAAHFMYRAIENGGGTGDWYFYFDTLFPEKGVHPYTRDQYTGSTTPSAKGAQAVIPHLQTRVRIIEGILRGDATPGDITNPDKRLDAIITRLYNLELWANGGAAPATGSNATYTIQQMLDFGDQ